MLSERMQKALNEQINAEFWSAYLYLSMSVDMAAKGYKGVSNWYAVQFREEQDHAQIFINYLLSRGCEVKLAPIAEVQTEWETPLASFEDTLEHERVVTSLINKLYALAEEEKDYATRTMLDWFVSEQVEEEENAQGLIDSLRMVDGSKMGLFMIDKDLAARTYTQASPLTTAE